MNRSRRVAGIVARIAAVGICGVWLAACSTSSQSSTTTNASTGSTSGIPNSVLAQAKSEGKLVVYTSITTAANDQAIQQAFEQQFPGVSLELLPITTSQLTTRYDAEAQSGSYQADAVLTGYSSFFTKAFTAGEFTKIGDVIPGFTKKYPAQYILGGGITAAAYMPRVGLAYNTKLVPSADVPQTWTDLGKAAYRGHLSFQIPTGGTTLLVFDELMNKYGDEFIQNLGQNAPKGNATQTGTPALQNVASGQAWAAIVVSQADVMALAKQGAPIKYVAPEPALGGFYTEMPSSHAPDPAAAKLFTWWVYSEAGQTALARIQYAYAPLAPNAQPPSFVKPPSDTSAASDLSKLQSLLGVQA